MDDEIVSYLTQAEVAWFNAKFATIDNLGKLCVVRLEDLVIYTPENFRKVYAHLRRFQERRGKQPLMIYKADQWLIDKRRRHYPKGFVFDPSQPSSAETKQEANQDSFNLWNGFAVEPKKGEVSPYLDFVREIVCAGDDRLYRWVMAWQAHVIQDPANKPGTALILRGEQGIGKSFFASCIGGILGDKTYMEVHEPELLIGRFNGHFKGKLLICADEGSYADNKTAGKLKSMVTGEKLSIEEKYHTPFAMDNYLRFIITGNHSKLIEASRDERRYCILDVSPARKGDTDYWDALHKWRDDGGLAALHHYLAGLHIDDVDLRTVPKTKALLDHKIESLDDIERWIYDCLERGYIVSDKRWSDPVPTDKLRQSFADHYGHRHDMAANDPRLGTKLKEIFPQMRKERKRFRAASPKYCYVMPSLYECRDDFEVWLGGKIGWLDPYSDDDQ